MNRIHAGGTTEKSKKIQITVCILLFNNSIQTEICISNNLLNINLLQWCHRVTVARFYTAN